MRDTSSAASSRWELSGLLVLETEDLLELVDQQKGVGVPGLKGRGQAFELRLDAASA